MSEGEREKRNTDCVSRTWVADKVSSGTWCVTVSATGPDTGDPVVSFWNSWQDYCNPEVICQFFGVLYRGKMVTICCFYRVAFFSSIWNSCSNQTSNLKMWPKENATFSPNYKCPEMLQTKYCSLAASKAATECVMFSHVLFLMLHFLGTVA